MTETESKPNGPAETTGTGSRTDDQKRIDGYAQSFISSSLPLTIAVTWTENGEQLTDKFTFTEENIERTLDGKHPKNYEELYRIFGSYIVDLIEAYHELH